MKIVFINSVVEFGSTGRIVASLYQYAEAQGEQARVVYGRKKCSPNMISYKVGSHRDLFGHICRNFFRRESGFGSRKATEKLVEYLRKEKPDVFHLHNLHGFYLNIEVLFEYIKKESIPVVWTLHDCWAFTGHCAYFDYVGCDKWKTGCDSCVQHKDAYPYALFCDNSRDSYIKKKSIFQGVEKLIIVTPSSWLGSLVRQSFLKEYPVKVIYNDIATDQFYQDESQAMKKDFKTVLGVANIWEKRKGLKYFVQLGNMLNENYRIVIVGLNVFQKIYVKKNIRGKNLCLLNKTRNLSKLRELYSQATVYVNTTLEDNFPTTNIEAISCGTPVVTFDTGGCSECISEQNGIVVPKGDINALAKAVEEVCSAERRGINNDKFEAGHSTQENYFMLYKELIKRKMDKQ